MANIYHYTDLAGLQGILENSVLWATDIRFLNDVQEFKHWEKILFNKLKISLSQEDEVLQRNLIKFLGYKAKNTENIRTYITSFSKKEDNMRQWMSYCNTNNKYCLKFNSDLLLINQEQNIDYNLTLKKVGYGEDTNIDEFSSHLVNQLNDLRAEFRDGKLDRGPIVGNEIAIQLFEQAACIKPIAFSDESEIRLIAQKGNINELPQGIKFRAISGITVPYLPIQINLNSLEDICIGPQNNITLAKLGLDDLLKANLSKFDKLPQITTSSCTLREF